MAKSRIVVDGSNIATEGRNVPSLDQLESALAELHKEYPKAEITVVVDATFAHRIDPSELQRFEDALTKGKYLSPPAGAIGRGDAFVLKIAEKSKAIVLSNDSFQEFHGDHTWLFEDDRLLGASPVPGVGWIFIPRTPVRGAKSRAAVRGVRNLPPMPKPKTPPPSRARKAAVAEAPVETRPTIHTSTEAQQRPHRRVATSVAAVNDPTTFITFIAAHPLGEIIEAEVESFTSHGAIIRYQSVQCYAPLAGLGAPAPRSAREVLARGEIRRFVIRGLDPERRGIELALPEVPAEGAGTVPADQRAEERTRRMRPRAKKASSSNSDDAKSVEAPASKAPVKKVAAKKVAAKKVVAKALPSAKTDRVKLAPKITVTKVAPTKRSPAPRIPKRATAVKAATDLRRSTKATAAKKTATTRVPAKTRVAAKKGPEKSASTKKTSSKVGAVKKRVSK